MSGEWKPVHRAAESLTDIWNLNATSQPWKDSAVPALSDLVC